MNYNSLRDRAITVKSAKEQSLQALARAEKTLELKSKELRDVKENKIIQEASLKILRQVLDTMAEDHINSIVDMVTFALQTIFYDRSYSVKISIGESRSVNTAELILVDSSTGKEIESDIPDSIGGGVSSVIGFVLQVFYIMYFKLERFMVLDESLSAVSNEYLPYLMSFINSLSEKRGFIFLAIVHDCRFIQYADKNYRMEFGVLREVDETDEKE